MVHTNKVSRSIETPEGTRCVDVFERGDGSFGFEEYRREPEDPSGWYQIGFYSDQTFSSEEAALEAARASVAWLAEVLERR